MNYSRRVDRVYKEISIVIFSMSASIKKNVKLGSFPVDGAEARVLEEADEVDLAGLLERHNRPSSESASRSCSQGCFTNEAPEGQLTDELRSGSAESGRG